MNVDAEQRLPERIRTPELYMPERQTAEEMTVEHLRRGLCAKSRGDWHECQACRGGCSFGARLVQVMTGQAKAPESTPEHIPARVMRTPKETNNRGLMSSEKRIAMAVDACRRVANGESYAAVARGYGYSGSGLVSVIKALGLEPPKAVTSNEERHNKRIRQHMAMLEAIDNGMDKGKAAREVGGYPNWGRARDYEKRHIIEIETLKKAKKNVSQAVAD